LGPDMSWGPGVSLHVKTVCWPQHVLFIVGVLAYGLTAVLRRSTPSESEGDFLDSSG
jgi:hypothetical protein